MNKQDRGFLYGVSLGDGCLYKQPTNKNTGLTIGHGPNQIGYLAHKAQKLTSLFGGKPVRVYEYSSYNKQSQKKYVNFQVRKVDPYFNQMHRILYPTGKKIITRQALDFLTDEGLAYWFMDDGAGTVTKNRSGNACGCMLRIATYCSKEEADAIAEWFSERYNLSVKFDIDKRNGKVSIRFGTLGSIYLAKLLAPYIIPEMMYKVSEVLKYVPRVLDSVGNTDEDIV